jgi:excisionase family DNA binding protein
VEVTPFPVVLSKPAEIAALLNVSIKTVYYWVERQEIPYIKVGKHLRFNASKVIEYFEGGTAENNPPCFKHLYPIEVKSSRKRSLTTREPIRSTFHPRKDEPE